MSEDLMTSEQMALWQKHVDACRIHERAPTELSERRVVETMHTFLLLFMPQLAPPLTAALRRKLKEARVA